MRYAGVMPGEAAIALVTYADYLRALEPSDVKLEYLDGVVRAMSGGTIEHARLAMQFGVLLATALAGRRCVVLSADARIRVDASNRTFFADASVVCGAIERSPADKEGVANPIVIVEVLSDTTEAYDRGDKFRHYRRLTSLREYVLVSQREPLVEVWRRDRDAWRVEEHGPGGMIVLASVDATLPLEALYANALG